MEGFLAFTGITFLDHKLSDRHRLSYSRSELLSAVSKQPIERCSKSQVTVISLVMYGSISSTTATATTTTVLVVAVVAAVILALVAHPAHVLRPTCVPKKVYPKCKK